MQFLGDGFKLFYFIYKQSPLQFIICGAIQLSIDSFIVFEFLLFSSFVKNRLSKESWVNRTNDDRQECTWFDRVTHIKGQCINQRFYTCSARGRRPRRCLNDLNVTGADIQIGNYSLDTNNNYTHTYYKYRHTVSHCFSSFPLLPIFFFFYLSLSE